MSDYENLIFDSLAPVDGEYGEVYVITDRFRAKARVVLNEFLQAMLFTNADDRMIINSYIEQGLSRLEAVKALEEYKKREGKIKMRKYEWISVIAIMFYISC